MTNPIQVTACRVYLNQSEDEHLKAFASIILNDCFAVCDLKIIQGNKGLFVAMPSRRRRDGTFHDVAHPINHTLREHIEQIVLNEYNAVTSQPPASAAPVEADGEMPPGDCFESSMQQMATVPEGLR
jgi:stage V sporulation protein G